MPRASRSPAFSRTVAILEGRDERPRSQHPQLLDHRPHRSREVHAGRPHPRDHRGGRPARPPAAAARLDGARARARHHDQGAGRARGVHGARRQALPPPPDRHARARGLHLRGLALARGLRRRAAAGGRLPGRGGADGREHLPRGRRRSRADPRAEQDRPAGRRARPRRARDHGAARRRPGRGDPRVRQDRRRRGGAARGRGPAHPAARGPGGRRPAGPHLRLRVRPVPRRRGVRPRGRRRAAQERPDRGHADRHRGRGRRDRLLRPGA